MEIKSALGVISTQRLKPTNQIESKKVNTKMQWPKEWKKMTKGFENIEGGVMKRREIIRLLFICFCFFCRGEAKLGAER